MGELSAEAVKIRDCLEDEGFSPQRSETIAVGVEDSHDRLELEVTSVLGDAAGPRIFVFETEAAARDKRPPSDSPTRTPNAAR